MGRGGCGIGEMRQMLEAAETMHHAGFLPEDESMDVRLGEALGPGRTFLHEYDFGSTTELKLRVLGEREEPLPARTPAVTLLARNQPPEAVCDMCGEPATQICTECIYEEGGLLCAAHAGNHACGEEMLLPLVNSPRAGVCGYTGPEDPAAT